MSSRFIRVVACVRISFLFKNESYSLFYTLFIHSPVDGHLGCLYLLALVIMLL